MSAPRLVIFDPVGRLGEVAQLATRIGARPVVAIDPAALAAHLATPVLVSTGVADRLTGEVASGPRWVLGDVDSAGKVAAAAMACGAIGVVIAPAPAEALSLVCQPAPVPLPEVELARARSLIAASIIDGNGEPTAE
ncbi:MAG: hypothetical protein KBD62_34665, partial [Kofleriaceae bacterium]|nr:hypothetical protein [Kofleriaceae bacterium]